MMPFILIWLKIKTNFIKLVLNTFIPQGHFHSKVIGMLVSYFLGYKIMILVLFGSSGNFSKMEAIFHKTALKIGIWVFLGV